MLTEHRAEDIAQLMARARLPICASSSLIQILTREFIVTQDRADYHLWENLHARWVTLPGG